MGRINRQIIQDILSYASIMAFIVLLLLAVAKVSQYLKQVSFGELPFGAVLSLVWLGLPALISTVLPIAVFFGVYFTFNRMYRHNEMTALAVAGMGLPRLLRPALGGMLVFLLIQLFTSFYWVPKAERDLAEKANQYARLAGMSLLQPGAFNRLPGGLVVYLGAPLPAEPDRFQGIFVYEKGEAGGQSRAITTAVWGQVKPMASGGLELTLLNGRRYMGMPGAPGFKILSFARYYVRLPPPKLGPGGGANAMSSKTMADLLASLHGPRASMAWGELEWRLGWPLTLPLLALLAMSLAYTPPRGGRAGGVLIGVLLLLIFNNLLLLAKTWVDRGHIAPFPGLWWVHVLILAVAVYAFYRRSRGLDMFPFSWVRV